MPPLCPPLAPAPDRRAFRRAWVAVAVTAMLAGLLLSGCVRRTREITGTVSVRGDDGRTIYLSNVRVSAYPKHVAKEAFTQAAPRIAAQFSRVAAQIEAMGRELETLTDTDGLDPAHAALLLEVEETLNLRATAPHDTGTREALDRRLADLRSDAERSNNRALLDRLDRLRAVPGSSAHA